LCELFITFRFFISFNLTITCVDYIFSFAFHQFINALIVNAFNELNMICVLLFNDVNDFCWLQNKSFIFFYNCCSVDKVQLLSINFMHFIIDVLNSFLELSLMLMFKSISALCKDAINKSEVCMSTFDLNAFCKNLILANVKHSFILSFHLYVSLISYSERFT